MKLRKRWLIAVLICGLQLIAALWLAIYGLNRFESRTLGLLGTQLATQWSNDLQRHLAYTEPAAKDQNLPEVAEHLGFWWSTTVAPQRFLFVGSFSEQEILPCHTPTPLASPLSWGVVSKLQPLQGRPAINLADIAYRPEFASIEGTLRLGDQEYLTSITRWGDQGRFLIVAQPVWEVFGEFLAWMSVARHTSFMGILLLGLLTIVLMTSILQKFETQLAGFHDTLQGMVEHRTQELNKTKNGIIFGLAKLAESRDNDTGDHLDRIRSYVILLANQLRGQSPEINDRFIQNLALASSLHDIGKVGIPDAVLLKPGRLTDLERKIMQFHTTIGCECLEAIEAKIGSDDFLKMAVEIARYHHERWDGRGYPDGIAGSAIPLAARIVAVADVYDALTSRRPYKEPMSHEKSFGIITAESGTQFDPMVVEAFRKQEERFREIMENYHLEVDEQSIVPAIAKLQLALDESPGIDSMISSSN